VSEVKREQREIARESAHADLNGATPAVTG
jgi:hypothetical protein